MKTCSAFIDKTFLANNTLNKENSMRNTNNNNLRKLNEKTMFFDNRREYEIL